MVKKRLADGSFCKKCRQAEDLLKKRGYWEKISEVIIADEDNPDSKGMKLAAANKVQTAPFFIVSEKPAGKERVYTSVLQLINTELVTSQAGGHGALSDGINISGLRDSISEERPVEIIDAVLSIYGDTCAIAFSGAEDVVLIDMAVQTGRPFSVFSLDTGRLHPETYRFIHTVREKYALPIQILFPKQELLEPFLLDKGLYNFYEEGHKECCGIRKVEPLRRALGGFQAWMTGQRKDQNPSTRKDVPVLQEDHTFTGKDGKPLIKCNPLAHWNLRQIWDYIRDREVPYNELHNRGYISIGCEPCTRPVTPGEHERAGRWWWEEETKRECGLHLSE